MCRTYGKGDDGKINFNQDYITNKKNAFRYPKDPTAVFPKKDAPIFLDVRTSALPLYIIMNEKGVKAKTRKHNELMEKVNKEINAKKEVNMEEDMKTRENDVIDLNKIANVDGELENLNFDNIDLEGGKRKKKKYANAGDVKMEKDNQFERKERQKEKRKKKSKSHFIANF